MALYLGAWVQLINGMMVVASLASPAYHSVLVASSTDELPEEQLKQRQVVV